jgi:hypothetical protein
VSQKKVGRLRCGEGKQRADWRCDVKGALHEKIGERPKESLIVVNRASIPLKVVNCCERNSIVSSLKAKASQPQNKESEEVQDETTRGWISKFTPYVRSEKGELSRCHFAGDGN